jgi:hypothetical protein
MFKMIPFAIVFITFTLFHRHYYKQIPAENNEIQSTHSSVRGSHVMPNDVDCSHVLIGSSQIFVMYGYNFTLVLSNQIHVPAHLTLG